MAGWQGLWTDVAATPSGYALLVNKNPIRNRARRIVNREGSRVMKELFDTLIGAASGGTASATHKRIGHPSTPLGVASLGGAMTIDTITDINRASTAADITALKEIMFNVKTRPTTYPRDLSGNGGPAFT